ncbi:MAG: hypothetical protein KAT90_04360 [Gammaproteobacteria bacterium]|nr:hypothetical protein [Gammaproteobacteria bacterium]
MKLLRNTKLGIGLITITLLTACGDPRGEAVAKYEGVSNVRETAGDYIMYEIEKGTVTCREHVQRAELACWKN